MALPHCWICHWIFRDPQSQITDPQTQVKEITSILITCTWINSGELCPGLAVKSAWQIKHCINTNKIQYFTIRFGTMRIECAFTHRITIKSCTVMPPRTAVLSKLSRLGHHTCCICCSRYQLQWPVMLGRSWLDAAENETAYQVIVVHRNSHST